MSRELVTSIPPLPFPSGSGNIMASSSASSSTTTPSTPPPHSPPPSSSPSPTSSFSSPFILSFLLLLSFSTTLLFLLPSSSSPSVPLPPSLSDLSLLRRAAATTPTGTKSPHGKIAFLFLTNSNLTFAPLWNRFLHGHSPLFNLYVHADPRSTVTPPGGEFRSSRFISPRPTRRATPSLIAATRRLLASALLDDPANSFFALLSQHCVPLHSFPYAYRLLSRNLPHRSFIEILSGEPGLWDRYVARGDDVMMPEVPFDRFRIGSQFFILTRRHAMMVIKDDKLWKKFRLPCLKERRYSCYPEEHYFPTLLSMEDPGGCSHYTLTRVNWTGSVDGHPHTYGPEEISPELIAELRRSASSYSYLFARKFAPESIGPLMQIADDVIFRD